MTKEVTQADSGMDGQSVERAELVWANLPTNRPWASLPTYEKALVCHTLARLTAQSGEGRSGAEEDTASLCDKPEWNKHSGGGNPVAPHNLVEIKQRGGDTGIFAAGSLTWKHGAFIWEVLDTVPEADIVAWRLVNPYKLNKALAALNARQSGEGERGQ